MAAGRDDKAPIIIKRIKKGGHGHHGGAWKVAYADFVTAMMAFFLLLWLLNATTKEQKEGIADYFTPTNEQGAYLTPSHGLRENAGFGFQGGVADMTEGKKADDKSPPGMQVGREPSGQIPDKPDVQAPVESTQDAQLFEKAEEQIKKTFENDPNFREMRDNIIVEQTPEGLKIEIRDSDKESMFEPGGAVLTPFGKLVLDKMNVVIKQMPNFISISGHTDRTGYGSNADYTNWELSADRANAARRYLMQVGKLETDRVAKVLGRADQDPAKENGKSLDPLSPRNRRISVILLRGSHLETPDENRPVPRPVLTVPEAQDIPLDKNIPVNAVTVEKPKAPIGGGSTAGQGSSTPSLMIPVQRDTNKQEEAPTSTIGGGQ